MKTIRKITQCILIGLTALMVQTAYAQKQVSDRALNCDSTCITPDSRTNTLQGKYIDRTHCNGAKNT